MNSLPLMLLPGALLCALLAGAVWHDVKSRKIPNRLVFSGALAGLALHGLLPAGAGFITPPLGGLGVLSSLAGLGIGLATLLPMYALGAMGAGDVKLMAMVGAFLGPQGVIISALLSMVAGGLLAITVSMWNGNLVQVLTNTYQLLIGSLMHTLSGAGVRIDAPAVATGKLPYAIAIAAGTLIYIVLVITKAWRYVL